MDTVTIRAGSDLVLDAAVGGKPEPKVSWAKGPKELELCEKYSLQYSSTRALAIIKFCDRDDTGKYVLTVKNASGTKTAEVNVKVLGMSDLQTANNTTLLLRYLVNLIFSLLFLRYTWPFSGDHSQQCM